MSSGRDPTRTRDTADPGPPFCGYDDIRITIPALGIEYRGGLTTGRPPEGGVWLTLVQYGGPDDGRTWRLYMRSYS